jgi:hypothetical protein
LALKSAHPRCGRCDYRFRGGSQFSIGGIITPVRETMHHQAKANDAEAATRLANDTTPSERGTPVPLWWRSRSSTRPYNRFMSPFSILGCAPISNGTIVSNGTVKTDSIYRVTIKYAMCCSK